MANNAASSVPNTSRKCASCDETKSMEEFKNFRKANATTLDCRNCRVSRSPARSLDIKSIDITQVLYNQRKRAEASKRKRAARDESEDEAMLEGHQENSPSRNTSTDHTESASSPPRKRIQNALGAPIPAAPSATPVNPSLPFATIAPYPSSGPAHTTRLRATSAPVTRGQGITPAFPFGDRAGPAALPADWSHAHLYTASTLSDRPQITQTIASGTQEQDPVSASSNNNHADTNHEQDGSDEEMNDPSPE